LATRVVAPTDRVAVLLQAAGMVVAGADRDQPIGWSARLAARIVAEASGNSCVIEGAAELVAHAQVRKGASWRRRKGLVTGQEIVPARQCIACWMPQPLPAG